MSCYFFCLSIIFLFLSMAKAETLWFMRNLTCLELSSDIATSKTCQRWNESTKMYYYSEYFHLCFPQGTLVQTQNGPKYIQELVIGDNVLSYNNKTQQNEYSPMVTWISRDQDAYSTFTSIGTQDELSYLISPLHNIAIWKETQSKRIVTFQFASQLHQGDELVAYSQKSLVKKVENSQQMRGLYAPLTLNSNYYVYPSGTKPNEALKKHLALAHCYSQIRSPTLYEKYITPLLAASSVFIDEDKAHFINPVYTKLRYFLGEQWKDQSQTVQYEVHDDSRQQKNLRAASFILQKGGGGGGGRGGGGSHGSSYHRTYFSSSYHTRKKSAIKLFSILSIMKDTVFNV